jgi:hypothetical protein
MSNVRLRLPAPVTLVLALAVAELHGAWCFLALLAYTTYNLTATVAQPGS